MVRQDVVHVRDEWGVLSQFSERHPVGEVIEEVDMAQIEVT
jgi:hypothetical protein